MRPRKVLAATAAVLLSAAAAAHPVPPITTSINFPSGLPWDALKPLSGSNPFGFDTTTGPTGAWPVTVAIGDIDNDGRDDYLLVMEQRLLLAIGMNVDASGVPTSPYVIWARFDPTGAYFKHDWSVDHACIHDFDGDGLNEVAAVIGTDPNAIPQLQNSLRLAVLGGTTTPDPAFGNVPAPQILASEYLDNIHTSWSSVLVNGQGNTVNVQAFDDDTSSDAAREILVNCTGSGMFAVMNYAVVSGTPMILPPIYSQGYYGSSSHGVHAFDMDNDGLDELLMNGYMDFQTGIFDQWSIPSFASCSNQYNHVDTSQPLDIDQDGTFELIMSHDCYDIVLQGAPSLVTPNIVTQNQLPIAQHGQDLCVGRFLPGPDNYGYDGRDYLATPKGCPIWNGSGWGCYVMNGNGDRLAANKAPSVSMPNGPNGWGPFNVDWDGARASDEVISKLGSRISIWQLVGSPAMGPVHSSCGYSPTLFDYSWTEISYFIDTIFAGPSAWSARDLYGDYRDEVVVFGRNGVMFATSAHPVPQIPLYLSPKLATDYQRRRIGLNGRAVDYQRMAKLSSIEVRPATLALSVNKTKAYQAIGHYVDADGVDVEVDLTQYAVFSSGDPTVASFSGNVLTTNAGGLAVLNCDVGGHPVAEVPMVRVTNSRRSEVVYAGWADTFLTGSQAPFRGEVRIVDGDNNATGVNLVVVGGAPILQPNGANDSGLFGDAIANDGVWTTTNPGFVVGAPHDDYITVTPVEPPPPIPVGAVLQEWPYLKVGNGGGVVASGVPIPWESELYAAGPWPKLRGVGMWPPTLAAGGTGTIRFFARVIDPTVSAIDVFAGGISLATGFNDAGTGADDFAGDGLWTGQFTVSTPLPNGKYQVDFIPRNSTPAFGDVAPRLRHHN